MFGWSGTGDRAGSRWRLASPSAPQLLVLSFLGLSGIGWLGFLVLPGLYTGEPWGAVDALFQATSAVCVTGLSVADVSRELTFWGQAWLLVLIQAGGLGMLTFAGLVTAMIGRRSRVEVEEAAAGPAQLLRDATPTSLLRAAVVYTFGLELLGAAALWWAWRGEAGDLRALWLGVFHAVSAFCNAGFSLFPDSLVGGRSRPGLLAVVAGLVVVGGLGFPLLVDVSARMRRRSRRLTVHTWIVLGTTAGLLVLSTAGYLFFESAHALRGLGPLDRLANAFFMAVTARTAGFNTVDYDALSNPGLVLTVGLMWVGGGPASLAGGVKVTTVALLVLLVVARLRGEVHVSVRGRTIPQETINRAAALAAGGLLLLAGLAFLLLVLEPVAGASAARLELVRVVFEVQSALSTVGLSMGITGNLSPAGRLLLVATMLLGRVGPLAVVGAMVLRGRRRVSFRYAHEDVIVG